MFEVFITTNAQMFSSNFKDHFVKKQLRDEAKIFQIIKAVKKDFRALKFRDGK